MAFGYTEEAHSANRRALEMYVGQTAARFPRMRFAVRSSRRVDEDLFFMAHATAIFFADKGSFALVIFQLCRGGFDDPETGLRTRIEMVRYAKLPLPPWWPERRTGSADWAEGPVAGRAGG